MYEFTSDGNTSRFETNIGFDDSIEVLVTVNGVSQTHEVVEDQGKSVVDLPYTPAENQIVSIIVLSNETTTKNYSIVEKTEFTATETLQSFQLENAVVDSHPLLTNVIVTVNDKVLHSGYSQSFTVGSQRDYQLDIYQVSQNLISRNQLEVYLNDRLLTPLEEWRFSGSSAFNVGDVFSGNVVSLEPGVGKQGDTLSVYVLSDAEYRFGFFNQNAEFVPTRGEDSALPTVYLDKECNVGDKIVVYTLSNHDSQRIQRQKLEVPQEYFNVSNQNLNALAGVGSGNIVLESEAESTSQVLVFHNGEFLMPSVDYKLGDDSFTISLSAVPQAGDVIELMHFSGNTVPQKIGWRQFKDILNRTHYKKLGKTNRLSTELKYNDTEIYLESSENIQEPSEDKRSPGVIFVDKERIEYFVKDGNMLTQLRRGTLGTGVKEVYQVGTVAMDQSQSNNIPYRDTSYINNFTGDDCTTIFNLNFDVASVNDIEVFVAGRRLRSNSLDVFDSEIAQDSPEGDVIIDEEYSVENNTLELTHPPQNLTSVKVIKRTGYAWNMTDTSLRAVDNDIASFLRRT